MQLLLGLAHLSFGQRQRGAGLAHGGLGLFARAGVEKGGGSGLDHGDDGLAGNHGIAHFHRRAPRGAGNRCGNVEDVLHPCLAVGVHGHEHRAAVDRGEVDRLGIGPEGQPCEAAEDARAENSDNEVAGLQGHGSLP